MLKALGVLVHRKLPQRNWTRRKARTAWSKIKFPSKITHSRNVMKIITRIVHLSICSCSCKLIIERIDHYKWFKHSLVFDEDVKKFTYIKFEIWSTTTLKIHGSHWTKYGKFRKWSFSLALYKAYDLMDSRFWRISSGTWLKWLSQANWNLFRFIHAFFFFEKYKFFSQICIILDRTYTRNITGKYFNCKDKLYMEFVIEIDSTYTKSTSINWFRGVPLPIWSDDCCRQKIFINNNKVQVLEWVLRCFVQIPLWNKSKNQ